MFLVIFLAAAVVQAVPLRNCETGLLALGVSCHDGSSDATLTDHCDELPCSPNGEPSICRLCEDKSPSEPPVKIAAPALASVAVAFPVDLTLSPIIGIPLVTVPAESPPPRACSLPLLI